MKEKSKLTLKLIIGISVLALIETLILNFIGYSVFLNVKSSLYIFGVSFCINLLFLAIFLLLQKKFLVQKDELIHFVNQQADDSLKTSLEALPVGIIRFNPENHQPEWYNKYSELIFNSNDSEINAELVKEILAEKEESRAFEFAERYYRITSDKNKSILYLQDMTAEKENKMSLADRRPIIGAISVDNYDEATDSLTEGEKSIVNSFIATFLEDFASSKKMYLRRQNSDRFIFFSYYQILAEMMDTSFLDLVDAFRKKAAEKKLNLSLSVGISYGVLDFAAIGKTSLNNLELALIRGGDQVVVRENEVNAHAMYFGGNSESRVIKSRTRVRAVTSMLKNIVSESNQVFIVGHRFPDMDALGAATVMKNFVEGTGKKEVFIVYEDSQLQDDVRRAIEKLNEVTSVTDHIIQVEAAKKLKTDNALLIMVDHSKLKQTQDKAFYDSFSKVVVIDHHRRDEDFPDNALLSYIESAASSATEMAIEILQFQDLEKSPMTPIEASVALAGIFVDTQSFTRTSTSKAFEAASYLRQQGASNEMVQYFLATDFETFKEVNEVVLAATIFKQNFAIAKGLEGKVYDKVILAQASNKLLTLKGVNASFSIAYAASGEVLISARSNGKVNVQAIMEKMGGGGHFVAAATQISDKTLHEIEEELLKVINEGE